MKKNALAFIIAFLPVCAFSQAWFAGGSLGFTYSKGENRPQQEGFSGSTDSHAGISVSPSIGININKFDFGINAGFGYEYWQNDFGGTTSRKAPEVMQIGPGIFARYNFISFGNFSFLGRFDADYLFNNRMDDRVLDYHRVDLRLSPVLQYKLLDRLLIFTNLGIYGLYYTYINYPNHASTTNNVGLSLPSGFSLADLSFGFFVTF